MALVLLTSCFWEDKPVQQETVVATGVTQDLDSQAELSDDTAAEVATSSTWSELSGGATQVNDTQSGSTSATGSVDLSDEEVLDIMDILNTAESDIDAIYETIEVE